jgi:hypothetical protein
MKRTRTPTTEPDCTLPPRGARGEVVTSGECYRHWCGLKHSRSRVVLILWRSQLSAPRSLTLSNRV